jgi:signal transduction histidine kinase
VIHDIEIKREYEDQKRQTERLETISQIAVTANDKINSPLNAILGYTELLEMLEGEPTAKQQTAFENIYKCVRKIKGILDKLRTYTDLKESKYNFGNLNMIDIISEFDEEDEEEE